MRKQFATARHSCWSTAVPWVNILLCMILGGNTVSAREHQGGCQPCSTTCCCDTQDVCICQRTTEKVKKPCWKVTCKKICIPPIRFPWQCGRLSGCGKVRTVRVLEKEESKETQRGYQWTVRTVRTGCGSCRLDRGEFFPAMPIVPFRSND